MSRSNLKTLVLAGITTTTTLLFSGHADARDEVRLPRNPYHEAYDWNRRTEPPRPYRSAQPIADHLLDRNEYPQGPYGPRVVKVVLSHADLLQAQNRIMVELGALEQDGQKALAQIRQDVTDLRRRLSWIEPLRHDSREQYQAYVDLADYVSVVQLHEQEARAHLQQIANLKAELRRLLSTPRPTQVVWNVVNHQNREHVPTDFLRRKAIEYISEHPEQIGRTIRLTF